MTQHIVIEAAQGTYVVRAGGAVLAETSRALILREGSYPPAIYFPRDDVAMAFFDASPTTTTCPHKGAASYFSLTTHDAKIADVAWSYEAPHANVAVIAGHLSFYTDRVAVEEL